jgi:hypothetical protein
MASSDFLNVNLSALCDDLAGEINKTYQHLPWALKNEAVSRLKRQVHGLSQEVLKAQASSSVLITQKRLQEALSLTHECVPLLSLCLKKNLVSPELHERWIKRLNGIGKYLESWSRACSPVGDK